MRFTFIILAIIIPVVIGLVISISLRSNVKKEKDMSPDSFVVRLGKMALIAGIACSIVSLGLIALTLATPNDSSSIWGILVFGLFALLGFYLIISYFTYRILFNENNIIKPGLFRTKTINYTDIKYAKLIINNNSKKNTLRLYDTDNKRLLSFDNACIGFNLAVQKLNKLQIEIVKKQLHASMDNSLQ